MVGIAEPVDASKACVWANGYLGRDLGWVPGWPHQLDVCWYWVAEPVPELTAAQAEQVLTQLLHAQAAGDLPEWPRSAHACTPTTFRRLSTRPSASWSVV